MSTTNNIPRRSDEQLFVRDGVKVLVSIHDANVAEALAASEKVEDRQRLNANKMSALAEQTGLRLSADRWASWRPTRETTGNITGFPHAVTCYATDGVLGWFHSTVPFGGAVDDIPSYWFFGHVHRFEWPDGEGEIQVGAPPSFYAKPKEKRWHKPKVKKKSKAEQLEDILATI